MKNIKIFAFLAIFLLSAAVSSAWAKDVTLTYKISVTGTIPHAYITNADGKTVCDWRNGIKTLWPANEGHTMNDGYGITFTPDQDLDKTDKNENKESTSTTAFRTEKNTTFTVSVGEGYYFKSVTFKEDNTEKASSSNIAPNSTSISVSVPKNKFFNYITVVLTNDFPYIDENGKEQIRKPGEYTVLTSLTDVSNLGGGWYVVQGKVEYTNQVKFSGDAHLILADGAEMTIESETNGIQADKNLTIYGQSKQSEQSGTLKVTATGLQGFGIYSYSGNITISGGKVTATGDYDGIYSYSGDITINGGSVTATGTNGRGIYSDNGVTISGGTVEATGKNGYGIYGYNGVTISGGKVTATSTNGTGIYGDKGVTISGGTVEATGGNYGIRCYKEVTISGGTVKATSKSGDGIYSEKGNIILGWTNSTDFIKASSYYSEEGSVQIAEGKSFKDEKGYVYRGTLTKGQVSDLKGQKLEPFEGVSVSFVDNFSEASDVFAEIAVDGEGHVSAPSKHPFHSGKTFIGWFTSPEGDSEFDFTVKVTGNTTAYAHWNENTPVEYIDENGKTKNTKNYILLTNDINVDNLPGGWYVVQGKVEYTSQVKFSGEAHLILADGAEMEIESETYGIQADKNLTIYGQSKQSDQSDQSGTLKVTATGSGIYSRGNITIIGVTVTDTSTSGNGIYSHSGDITIIGGSVTATGTNGIGIFSLSGDITISGGTVEASGSSYSIYGFNGVKISGGSVKATSESGFGIYSNFDDITLGWTNSTDSIKASSYSGKNGVSIAEGKSFKDENGIVYSGTLTGEQLSAIKGKTLEPCYAVTFDAQNGDEPIMLLTTFDENGVAHVEKPNDPIRSGFTFEGWFTAKDGNTEFDFSAAITGNTTAYAKWGVPYIDEKGKPQIRKPGEYTVLTEDNKPNEDGVINLPGGWYVVQGKVKYSNQVKFSGDAHLILADGAKMEIETEGELEYGIYASNNLTIYGQNEQSGILNDTAKGTDGSGIYSYSGDITIIGGKVTAASKSGDGIISNGDITISGGSVTATGNNGIFSIGGDITISGGTVAATGSGLQGSGIISILRDITISGGKVTATGEFYGIYSNSGDITLGWTNSTDNIKASSYYGKNGVSIAEGKSFKDDKGKAYRGTLTGEQLSAIKSKKLEPCYAVTFDAQNGDDPIMLLTTFDENGVAHVAKPNDPIRSGFTFEGWFTAKDGNTEFDFTATVTENTTAYAHWNENTPVEYIDENGGTNETKNYILLTNDINVDNLPGGWYVVQGEVKYTSQVKFIGDAHLILADDATIEIKTESKYGIYASNNLTIYGQSGQGGILNDTAKNSFGSGIYGKGTVTIIGGTVEASGTNGYGIYGDKGVTISGGTVTATSTNGPGIYGYNGVTISGGSVEAVGKYGIDGSKGVTISGGTVTATGIGFYGIHSSIGNITLGWTNSTDSIKASSYYGKNGVSIAEGKSFKDENGIVYSGTLTGEQLSAIKGNKLEPCYAVTFDAQNGDEPIMLLTTFDENGVAHVEKPNDPIRSGFTFEGWFTTKDGNTEFDFTKAVTENTTAYAHWNENTPVEYIDEKGETKKTKNYILLTNDINVDNLPGGWYVVQGEVKYTSQVKFIGDAHLILADGAEMVIESETYGIQADKNLTIYGQNNQNGILKATGSSYGINGYNVTISGGSVTATGENGDGIESYNNVTVSGGTVEATSKNGNGIYSYKEVTISGGTVTASGNSSGINTKAGHITLGWTNSTDFIKVSSIHLGADSCTVSIAEGKSFVDEKGNEYRGTLTGEQLSAIKGNRLEPCYAVTFDAQNGDDPIMLLTSFDENGVAHVKKPNDPIRSGFTFEGWFTATDGNVEFDFTKAVTGNTIAYAHWNENTPVEYIDENGGTNETKNYILLTNGIKVDNLPGGWYVVQGEVKYASQVKFEDDAHLILADGAEMVIESETYGIQADKNLTIYGQSKQSDQSGTLKVTATGSGIYSRGNITIIGGTVTDTSTGVNGIYSHSGDITIIGGSVTATGTNGIGGIYSKSGDITIIGGSVTATGIDGICGGNGVSISGGSVTATGKNGDGIYSWNSNVTISGGTVEATGNNNGIYSSNGVTISGGSVTATGNNNGISASNGVTINGGTVEATGNNNGIYSSNGVTINGGTVTATGTNGNGIASGSGDITLSWTNSSDFIYASSYYSEKGSVQIAEGKLFKDEKGKAYSGTINPVSDIAGKTLVPPSFNGKFLSDVNIAVADIPVQKYVSGKPVCPSVLVTDGKDTLKAGTDYTVVCSNNNAITSATLDKAAVAQITGKGNYAGAIQKRFFIWKNIRDYAAVQVFQDAGGKTHAEIDGAYDGTDAVVIDEEVAVDTVVFSREFTVNLENGGFSTIMLPFDVSASNLTGVKSIFEFNGVDNNAVGVNYVWCNAKQGKIEKDNNHPDCSKNSGELKAYTPYMVEMDTPTLGINGKVTLKSRNNATNSVVRKGKWVFRGALEKKEWSKEDDDIKNGQIWAFAGSARNGASIGKFVQFGGNNWVNPFRAYLVDCTTYPDASECKDETQPEPSFVSRYRFADVLAPATSAENSLSAKTPAAVAASETALLNSMDIVIVYGDSASGERPTVIGRMNPATGEIRMLPRTKQTYDLKGRRVNEGRKAKGAYYRR